LCFKRLHDPENIGCNRRTRLTGRWAICILCDVPEEWETLKQWSHLKDTEKETVLESVDYDAYEYWEIEFARFKIFDGRIMVVEVGGNA
jgi:hypothetical protein